MRSHWPNDHEDHELMSTPLTPSPRTNVARHLALCCRFRQKSITPSGSATRPSGPHRSRSACSVVGTNAKGARIYKHFASDSPCRTRFLYPPLPFHPPRRTSLIDAVNRVARGRQEGDYIKLTISSSNVTAVRMQFPADREFVFDIEYDGEDDDIIEVRDRSVAKAVGPSVRPR